MTTQSSSTTRTTCDRCGKVYERVGLTTDLPPEWHAVRIEGDHEADLCHDCYWELQAWLKEHR